MTWKAAIAMPYDPGSSQPFVFKDNWIVLLWVLVAAAIAILVFATVAAVDAPGGLPFNRIVDLALIWVGVLVFTAAALWIPRVRVEISHGGVLVRERALLWKRSRQFAAKEVSGIVEEQQDDEGGVYYTCSLVLPDNVRIVLARDASRSEVAQVRVQVIKVLMNAERRGR